MPPPPLPKDISDDLNTFYMGGLVFTLLLCGLIIPAWGLSRQPDVTFAGALGCLAVLAVACVIIAVVFWRAINRN